LHDYWKQAKEILSIPIQTKSVGAFSTLLEQKMKGNEHGVKMPIPEQSEMLKIA
jgi:hypothetical protein